MFSADHTINFINDGVNDIISELLDDNINIRNFGFHSHKNFFKNRRRLTNKLIFLGDNQDSVDSISNYGNLRMKISRKDKINNNTPFSFLESSNNNIQIGIWNIITMSVLTFFIFGLIISYLIREIRISKRKSMAGDEITKFDNYKIRIYDFFNNMIDNSGISKLNSFQ